MTTQTETLKTPAPSVATAAKAAEKELAAFLAAVQQVFINDEVQRAADLWILGLETTDWTDANAEQAFRQLTIRTSAQLAEGSEEVAARQSISNGSEQ